MVFTLTLLATPFILTSIARWLHADATRQQGVALVFITLLVWLLISGTDIARATLGGMALKTLAAFKQPFQLGDRVTLHGISGKVVGFDSFLSSWRPPIATWSVFPPMHCGAKS